MATRILVIGGVAYTVIAVSWIIGLQHTLIVAGAFAASGAPMVLGSIARHISHRRAEERALRDHARRMTGA